MPQSAPGHDAEQDGRRIGAYADGRLDALSQRVPDRPGDLEPERGDHHDGERDKQETHAVAAHTRLHVTGAAADATGDAAETARQAVPDRR